MELVQAWKDSLALLKPQNMHLFLLVTLKSVIEAYKTLLLYWWWLFAILLYCCIVPYYHTMSMSSLRWFTIIVQWSFQLLIFASLLATRSSVEQKNCSYFREHMLYFLAPAGLLLFIPIAMWPSALTAVYVFFVLFYLDSQKRLNPFKVHLQENDSIRSLWNAVKMVLYSYPLLIITGIFFLLPGQLIFSYLYPCHLLYDILAIVLTPVSLCFYTNIYIKKLHEQFDLYFEQPK